nr:MAG TPA: Dipeptidyl peptidase IV (DPP IV) low complexity region [Caudoviricetes sp.]
MRVYTQRSAPLQHYLNSTFQKGANNGQPFC